MSTPTRIIVTAPIADIERAVSETQLRKATAGAINFECSDGSPNRTLLKYASEAVAARLVATEIPWPVSTDVLLDGLAKLGVNRQRAEEFIGPLVAAGNIRAEREMIQDRQAADIVTSLLSGAGFRLNGVRTADTPVREPEPRVDTKVPRHENEVTEGTLPDLTRKPYEPTDEPIKPNLRGADHV